MLFPSIERFQDLLMKKIYIILACAALAFHFVPTAAQSRFFFGMEWGLGSNISSTKKVNYLSSEGYRVNETISGFDPYLNANILLNAGMIIGKRTSISLCSGYMGISNNFRTIPLMARFNFHFNGVWEDGLYLYVSGGRGFRTPCNLAVAGVGLRTMTGPRSSVDFSIRYRGTLHKPTIYDKDSGQPIPKEKIRRNIATYSGADLSISLYF